MFLVIYMECDILAPLEIPETGTNIETERFLTGLVSVSYRNDITKSHLLGEGHEGHE